MVFPAGVTVTQTGESFRVVTYINLSSVRASKRDSLREIAADTRSSDGQNGNLGDEQSFVRLRVRRDLTLERAVDETLSEMVKLVDKLKPIH